LENEFFLSIICFFSFPRLITNFLFFEIDKGLVS
jgi:hypothetical protein